MDTLIGIYLNLLKDCIQNLIHSDLDQVLSHKDGFWNDTRANLRISGRDWPKNAHTMIGRKRLDNLQFCVEEVIANSVPGDLIETGVWRGGATILMRGILKAYGIEDRNVWVADSFEGLPAPNAAEYPPDEGIDLHLFPELSVSQEEVEENFNRYDLLDEQVKFLKGWFKNTLPQAPIESLAVMRLDGDYYESTMDALANLYPKLSIGGFVIIDDFGAYEACRQAVTDYRESNGINEEIKMIDWTGAYWKKKKGGGRD